MNIATLYDNYKIILTEECHPKLVTKAIQNARKYMIIEWKPTRKLGDFLTGISKVLRVNMKRWKLHIRW